MNRPAMPPSLHDLPTNGHATGADGRKPPLLPPHVAWPLFIVLLLTMSVAAAAVTVIAAYSDGGAQIVEGSPYDPNRHETGR